jgi:hypothetical protein
MTPAPGSLVLLGVMEPAIWRRDAIKDAGSFAGPVGLASASKTCATRGSTMGAWRCVLFWASWHCFPHCQGLQLGLGAGFQRGSRVAWRLAMIGSLDESPGTEHGGATVTEALNGCAKHYIISWY